MAHFKKQNEKQNFNNGTMKLFNNIALKLCKINQYHNDKMLMLQSINVTLHKY